MAESLLEYCILLEREQKLKDELKERLTKKKKRKKPLINEIMSEHGLKPFNSDAKKPGGESEDESMHESDENSSYSESGEDDDFTGQYLKKKSTLVIGEQPSSPAKKEEECELERDEEDEDDRFYSDEEEDESKSPVHRPSDLKGLLKHKQKKTRFDMKSGASSPSKSGKARTLDQLLQMI